MNSLDNVADVLETVDQALDEGKSSKEIVEMVRELPVEVEDILIAVMLLKKVKEAHK